MSQTFSEKRRLSCRVVWAGSEGWEKDKFNCRCTLQVLFVQRYVNYELILRQAKPIPLLHSLIRPKHPWAVYNSICFGQELAPHKRLLPSLSGTQQLLSFFFCHDPLLMKKLPAFLPTASHSFLYSWLLLSFMWPWFVLKSAPWLISETRKAGKGKCFCSNYDMHIVYPLARILAYFFLLEKSAWRDGKKPSFSSLEAGSLFFHKKSLVVKEDFLDKCF